MSYAWQDVPPEGWAEAVSHIKDSMLRKIGEHEIVRVQRDLDPGRVSYATEMRATARRRDGSLCLVEFYDMLGTMVVVRDVPAGGRPSCRRPRIYRCAIGEITPDLD